MIWEMKIICVSGRYLEDDCIRVLEIDSSSSLSKLHQAIQDAVDFDRDHLYDFYAGRHAYNRKLTFADDYEWEDREDKFFELTLEQIYPMPKSCKLYYLFDLGDDWRFEIRKSRKKPTQPKSGIKYPRVIESIGPNPVQYPSYEDFDG